MQAIYTLQSIDELRALPTEHPMRSIPNNDLAIIFQEKNIIIGFNAINELTPEENFPTEITSNDNRISWQKSLVSYSDGGIPKSTRILVAPSRDNIPNGWKTIKILGISNEVLCEKQEASSYARLFFDQYSRTLYSITWDSIKKYDFENNNTATSTSLPILAGETSTTDWHRHAISLCQEENKIYFVGGTTSPSNVVTIYDASTNTFSIGTPLPRTTTDAILIDASSMSRHMFLLSADDWMLRYRINDAVWAEMPNKPLNLPIKAFLRNPGYDSIFAILFSNEHLYHFDAILETWEFIANLDAVGWNFEKNGSFGYDLHTKRYFFIFYDEITFYDIESSTKEIVDIAKYILNSTFIGEAPAVWLGGNYYAIDNAYELDSLLLFTPVEAIEIEKE